MMRMFREVGFLPAFVAFFTLLVIPSAEGFFEEEE